MSRNFHTRKYISTYLLLRKIIYLLLLLSLVQTRKGYLLIKIYLQLPCPLRHKSY